jgi:RNA polymerase sigma-32 factor
MDTSSATLAAYAAAVRRVPVLAAEEEVALARAYQRDGNAHAARRLIESHLRLVVRTAYSLRGYGVPLADLIAEGNVGLMLALKRFDPERGLRFSTYAMWWVRAAMLEAAMQQATPVKVALTAERKKIFFKLRSLAARLRPGGGWLSDDEAAAIAAELKVRREHVSEMETLLSPDFALDAPREPGGAVTWQDSLAANGPTPEEEVAEREETTRRRKLLAVAWTELSDREKTVIADRCLREQPLRLEDLAQRFGVSRERVRQIEAAAMKKLQRLVGGATLAPQGA